MNLWRQNQVICLSACLFGFATPLGAQSATPATSSDKESATAGPAPATDTATSATEASATAAPSATAAIATTPPNTTESIANTPPPADFLKTPTPYLHSYRRANAFDGKIGLGTLWMRSDPFGASTGYGQFFLEGDYDGIGETGFSLHVDLDARSLLFEARDAGYVADDNRIIGALQNPDESFYRQTGVYASGRNYNYLRLDKLNLGWESDAFGLIVGRMWVDAAAQAPVDGVHLHLGLGDWGRVGIFGGLKNNPWHQQLVGASSGGSILNGAGQILPVLWGDVVADDKWQSQEGAYANELGTGAGSGLPWTHVATLRFLTAGVYGQIRGPSLFLDSAMVVDLFDASKLDRVWGHVRGGARITKDMMLAFRGTLDVLGARPLFPRDVYLDLHWRNLGPLSVRMNYSKFNTAATASSYGVFFRPLEDPNQLMVQDNPWRANANAAGAGLQALYAIPAEQVLMNRSRLFLVDRDRVRAGAALDLWRSMELYGEITGERRGDVAYQQDPVFADSAYGLVEGLANLGAFCEFDPDQDPYAFRGADMGIPVYADLCRYGASVGIRDPFLGGIGSFDLNASYRDGYFQNTARLSARLGVALADTLWTELGGAYERNENERVYTGTNSSEDDDNADRFFTQATSVYLFDALVSWRIYEGLILEGSYFGFLEEIPFQGDTIPLNGQNAPAPRDTSAFTQTLYARMLYRF